MGLSTETLLAIGADVPLNDVKALGFDCRTCCPQSIPPDDRIRAVVWSNEITVPADLLTRLPGLQMIINWGTEDLRFEDQSRCTGAGVEIASIQGYATQALAEYCVLQLLAAARHYSGCMGGSRPLGQSFWGCRVGILGTGRIGTRVGKIMAESFGAELWYFSRREAHDLSWQRAKSPAELFSRCDYVVIATRGRDCVLDTSCLKHNGHCTVVNLSGEGVISVRNAGTLTRDGHLRRCVFDIRRERSAVSERDDESGDRISITEKVAYKTDRAIELRRRYLRHHLLRLKKMCGQAVLIALDSSADCNDPRLQSRLAQECLDRSVGRLYTPRFCGTSGPIGEYTIDCPVEGVDALGEVDSSLNRPLAAQQSPTTGGAAFASRKLTIREEEELFRLSLEIRASTRCTMVVGPKERVHALEVFLRENLFAPREGFQHSGNEVIVIDYNSRQLTASEVF